MPRQEKLREAHKGRGAAGGHALQDGHAPHEVVERHERQRDVRHPWHESALVPARMRRHEADLVTRERRLLHPAPLPAAPQAGLTCVERLRRLQRHM